ncbi:MAG TPA: hypothetical protein VK671_00045, partial [Mucilaginibacter sp.]|nr:hypothetical protein [Mucilaginibacter sp.]
INYFNINGLDSYQRYVGPISLDITDKDHLGYMRDTSSRIATVFLQVLQKGKNLSLYSYTDALKLRLFVGERPVYAPKELAYRLYYNYSGDKVKGQSGVTVNENTYMRQLFALANQYGVLNDDLQRDIERVAYRKEDVLEIVSKINDISKADFKKSNGSKGSIFNVFVGAGVNIVNTSTVTGSPYYNAGGRSQTSYGAAGSFGINFFANPNTRQLQLRVEAGIARSKYNWLYNSKVSPYIPFRASFDKTAFSITPQVLYNFYNAENFKVYGDVGLELSFYNFSNAYLGSQSQPNSASDIEENNPYFFNKTDNSFLFKMGVQIHKNWGIFAQYTSGVAITQGGYFQMSSTCEQIGLNYYFW